MTHWKTFRQRVLFCDLKQHSTLMVFYDSSTMRGVGSKTACLSLILLNIVALCCLHHKNVWTCSFIFCNLRLVAKQQNVLRAPQLWSCNISKRGYFCRPWPTVNHPLLLFVSCCTHTSHINSHFDAIDKRQLIVGLNGCASRAGLTFPVRQLWPALSVMLEGAVNIKRICLKLQKWVFSKWCVSILQA